VKRAIITKTASACCSAKKRNIFKVAIIGKDVMNEMESRIPNQGYIAISGAGSDCRGNDSGYTGSIVKVVRSTVDRHGE
jgi:hypothetical protein